MQREFPAQHEFAIPIQLDTEIGDASGIDRPGGLRIGTIEIMRLGMGEAEIEAIADFIIRILIEQVMPEDVRDEVVAFRQPYQTLYYCFENGLPTQA